MMQIIQREVEVRECSAGASPLNTQPPTRLTPCPRWLVATQLCLLQQPSFLPDGDRSRTSEEYPTYHWPLLYNMPQTTPYQSKVSVICLMQQLQREWSICTASQGQNDASSCAPARLSSSFICQPKCITTTSSTPILLQTARATMPAKWNLPPPEPSRESNIKPEVLQHKTVRSESVIIKTFGSVTGNRQTCEVVELKILTKNQDLVILATVVVPYIYDLFHLRDWCTFVDWN